MIRTVLKGNGPDLSLQATDLTLCFPAVFCRNLKFLRFCAPSTCRISQIRKSVMSIKFPPAIPGPEMAAPILWAPGFFSVFLLENAHAHKIPPFRAGGVLWFLRRGGLEVPILFLWAWGFCRPKKPCPSFLDFSVLPRKKTSN